MDWSTIAKLAQEAFRTGVNDWIGRARIQGGTVRGPTAHLTPGSLVSAANIEASVSQSLTGSKVPTEIAWALAKVLATAWNDWASGFQIVVPLAYPTFAAFPGPAAPPTPAAPISVAQRNSAGEASLNAVLLTNKLLGAVLAYAAKADGGDLDGAMLSLGTWIESSFNEWKSMTKIVGLQGSGGVPTFAPPYVPVGPVVAGVNVTIGTLFAGPRFGKVVIQPQQR